MRVVGSESNRQIWLSHATRAAASSSLLGKPQYFLSDLNDLFNVANVFFVVVDGAPYLGDGGNDGFVSFDIVCERNCNMHSPKWLNGGIRMWNHWYRGFNIFLV